MSKSARPGPKRLAPKHGGAAAKVEAAPERDATAEKSRADTAVLAPPVFEFPAKRRCQGATRYGQPCRLWATAGGDFCYWCERAGRPRYPLATPAGETASPAATRKQRCRGVTVFGEPCGYFSASDGGLCLWCQGAERRGKETEPRQ
jgi:hypothetical protein